jgi:hypothetical protein
MSDTSFVTKSRRDQKETTSMKELRSRLDWLYSRVNSGSDPAIQALIKRTQESLAAAEHQQATWPQTQASQPPAFGGRKGSAPWLKTYCYICVF